MTINIYYIEKSEVSLEKAYYLSQVFSLQLVSILKHSIMKNIPFAKVQQYFEYPKYIKCFLHLSDREETSLPTAPCIAIIHLHHHRRRLLSVNLSFDHHH